jgi:hypothetical protein
MLSQRLGDKLTPPNLLPAPLDALFQLAKSVERCQYLHTTHGIQHVGIVCRSSAEATIFMQTREDKVKNALTWKSVGLSQEVQGRQSPVEAIEAQVFGEPVLELVFALERVSAG